MSPPDASDDPGLAVDPVSSTPLTPSATQPTPSTIERSARRRAAALAGHEGDGERARALLTDPDPDVRATSLRALARAGAVTTDDLRSAAVDPATRVRSSAAEVVANDHGGFALDDASVPIVLATLLADDVASVVEIAAWATGEWVGRMVEDGFGVPELDLVTALAGITAGHDDALCREAAVAALGAIGDDAALPVILAATTDKAPVRRRAVIALAPFEGEEVTAALERGRLDRDWQVRQAAEDLLLDGEVDLGEDDHDGAEPREDDDLEPEPGASLSGDDG